MLKQTGLAIEQEWIFKATNPALTLDELEAKLRAAGNNIIRREADGIVIGHEKRTQRFTTEE